MSLMISSKAFVEMGEIPVLYTGVISTGQGRDISPPLAWTGVPAEAKSLVLIVDDPDAPDPAAPKMTWVHWLLYNLPVELPGLAEGARLLPVGTLEGINDWKRTGYGGPKPPKGCHRYFHKLYVLDVRLPDLNKPTKAKLEEAMKGHILAEACLIGTFKR